MPFEQIVPCARFAEKSAESGGQVRCLGRASDKDGTPRCRVAVYGRSEKIPPGGDAACQFRR